MLVTSNINTINYAIYRFLGTYTKHGNNNNKQLAIIKHIILFVEQQKAINTLHSYKLKFN